MENYSMYLLMGGHQRMKEGVVPHKFDCQPGRQRTWSKEDRSGYIKFNRKREISIILKENDTKLKENILPDSSDCVQHSQIDACNKSSSIDLENAIILNSNDDEIKNSRKDSQLRHSAIKDLNIFKDLDVNVVANKTVNKLKRPHYRSKGLQISPSTKDFGVNTNLNIDERSFVDRSCSPIHILNNALSTLSSNTKSSSAKTNSSSDYVPSSVDDAIEEEDFMMKKAAKMVIDFYISRNPFFYLRIPEEWMWIVSYTSNFLDIPDDYIKCTLMKIKLDDQYMRIGHQFVFSTAKASRIFRQTVPKLLRLFKPFIFAPSKTQVKKLLPLPFRANFSDVFAIVDCLEIQIEKPSNPLHQALTWSEYKKCNTLKYLLCITPDGLIIFVSEGYGGRVSDIELFETCGIMNILPEKSCLLADRGFKNIASLLGKKNIKLVRPPSVSSTEKPSKQEVLLTKRIASIRIHVERSVRRLREFSMLEPHSTLHHSLLSLIDEVVVIAAGLINLQSPLIKT